MVEKQTNYLFFYDSDEINKQQRITINQTNSSLKDVLDAVASKTNLSYTIKGRHIILAKKAQRLFYKQRRTRKRFGKEDNRYRKR
ncbi:STN domain-containing protein [Bacteroides ovatus]|nr:STN domain-containing protein [Bacteroides ovatus]UVR11683.1 STN domain-containing protein [Bacteroides ovatus]